MKQTNGSSAVLVDCVTADKGMYLGEDENCGLSSSKTKATTTNIYCIDD